MYVTLVGAEVCHLSPEWIAKADGDVGLVLVRTVHSYPQLTRVTPTCCKCKNG